MTGLERNGELSDMQFCSMRVTCGEVADKLREKLVRRRYGRFMRRDVDSQFHDPKASVKDILEKARIGLIINMRENGEHTHNYLRDMMNETSPELNMGVEDYKKWLEISQNPMENYKDPSEMTNAWSLIRATHAVLTKMGRVTYQDIEESKFEGFISDSNYPSYWFRFTEPEEWFNLLNRLNYSVSVAFDHYSEVGDPRRIIPAGHFFSVASKDCVRIDRSFGFSDFDYF